MLKYVTFQGESYEKFRHIYNDTKSIAFSSDRKRMTTFFVVKGDKPFCRVFVKGAAEVILQRCVSMIHEFGEVKALTLSDKQTITKTKINRYASEGYRNITLAYKDISIEEYEKVKELKTDDDINFFENELTFIGICAIQDPLRPGIPEAVR